MSKKVNDVKISYWAAHFTTIVSVTMLLVLVGAICLLGLTAGNTARDIKQQQQVSLVMADTVTNEQAARLTDSLKARPYVHQTTLITKEQALADWNASTGDDAEAIAGYNFFTPEIELSLKADYTTAAALAEVQKQLAGEPGVDEVVLPDAQVISSMDSFFSRVMFILGIVAIAMIAISFVLINNTVLLTIYSRRFTIHTMQLVGATPGFIRRPFIASNAGAGVVAGLMAALVLGGAVQFISKTQMPELSSYLSAAETWTVCVLLIIAGAGLCSLSAFIATNRYLRKDYDDLFN